MKAIVAVDQNWGIGYQGDLLQRIPDDMKFFKQMTIHKVVIMGRGTFDSLPGRTPLPDRINIVLSKTLNDEFGSSLIVCQSLAQLLEEIRKYDPDDLCVIGGESIFNLLLPYCSEVYVTKILKTYPADKYFTNIDRAEDWQLVYEGELQSYKDIQFKFTKYTRKCFAS